MFRLRHGHAADAPLLLALFDDAVSWLVDRGQTGQWGTQPFSERPANAARAHAWAAGGGLWFAVEEATQRPAGAIVLGGAPPYVPPADRPELYVEVLLTAREHRGQGVGRRLVEHAAELARERGAVRLRVDCWDGTAALPAQYERLGFTRTGSFVVDDWPGAILERAV